jgi:hypothetical protein
VVVNQGEVERTNPFTDKEILENIPIEELANYKDVVIIYNQHELNRELDEIIALYTTFPKSRTRSSRCRPSTSTSTSATSTCPSIRMILA